MQESPQKFPFMPELAAEIEKDNNNVLVSKDEGISTTLDLNICRRILFKVDLIDILKWKFRPGISLVLFGSCIIHSYGSEKLRHNYPEIVSQSDCLKHQYHWISRYWYKRANVRDSQWLIQTSWILLETKATATLTWQTIRLHSPMAILCMRSSWCSRAALNNSQTTLL